MYAADAAGTDAVLLWQQHCPGGLPGSSVASPTPLHVCIQCTAHSDALSPASVPTSTRPPQATTAAHLHREACISCCSRAALRLAALTLAILTLAALTLAALTLAALTPPYAQVIDVRSGKVLRLSADEAACSDTLSTALETAAIIDAMEAHLGWAEGKKGGH